MIFTASQISDMLSILKKYELMFIANQLGTDFLTAADKAILLAAGIDVDQFKNAQGIIEHAFLFGILAEAIGDARAKKMNYKQFQKFLKSKNFIPLTEEEELALQNVKQRAYTDITNLSNRMTGAFRNVVLKNNQEQLLLAQKIVRDKAVTAIELRQGATKLAQELADAAQSWDTDWLRVAYYILHEAYNTGRSQSILKNNGADAEVYFDVFPKACKKCKELYLEDPDDENSRPKIFKLKDLIANGNNIGRKQADWLPTIGPIHPYCFNSPAVKIYTSKGWKNISEIKVGDLVLTHMGRYKHVTKIFRRKYNGEKTYELFYSFPGSGYKRTRKCRVRAITGNHPILTKRGWVTVEDLTIGDKVFIPALVCSKCGKLKPISVYDSCSNEEFLCYDCLRTKIAKEQWKDENFHKYISRKTSDRFSEEDIVNNGDKVFDELSRIFNNHSGNYCLMEVTLHAIKLKKRTNERGICEYLYNFSVEDDESYIADGIVVHNCRCILNHKPAGFAWDENLRAFTKPIKKVSNHPKLKGVKLNIKVTK